MPNLKYHVFSKHILTTFTNFREVIQVGAECDFVFLWENIGPSGNAQQEQRRVKTKYKRPLRDTNPRGGGG